MKKMISVRKEVSAFADFNKYNLLQIDNQHLLCFIRFNHQHPADKILVIANFDANPQFLDLETITHTGINTQTHFSDLYSGKTPTRHGNRIVLQGYQFYWLTAN